MTAEHDSPNDFLNDDQRRAWREIPPGPDFRPLRDRVLVKRNETPKKIGLIDIPDVARTPPPEGRVVAIGDKVFDVEAGDKIRFIKNTGTAVKLDEENDHILLNEMDIYGVLENGTLRPISSKVLIKPDPPDEMVGHIFIPPSLQKDRRNNEALVSGQVVAMGLGMRTKKGGRWPMPDVKIGQRVLYFQSYSPELEIGGITYVVVADDQLRAVIEEDPNGQG